MIKPPKNKALLAIAALIAALGFGYWFMTSSPAREAKAFVDDSVPHITAQWDINTLYTYLETSGSSAPMARDQMIIRLAVAKQKLGNLVSYEGAHGKVETVVAGGQKMMIGKYVASGQFQNGKGYIDLLLFRGPAGWKLHDFNARLAPPAQN